MNLKIRIYKTTRKLMQSISQELTAEQMYLHLTDGDMDFGEYLDCLHMNVDYALIRQRCRIHGALYDITGQPKKRGRPPVSDQEKNLNCSRYVRFTKKQIEYLRGLFEINPKPNNYEQILMNLLKLSYPGQSLTKKKVLCWFKNERWRRM